MAYNVLDVANEICKYGSSQELMSVWKIQEMLYFHQGFYLATFGEPLFYDMILATKGGPIVGKVSNHYILGYITAVTPDKDKLLKLNDQELDLFDKVNHKIGQYSAGHLYEIIKKTDPYRNAIEGNNKIICKEEMEKYFKKSNLLI